jgi:glucose-1-phosphate thymidylyltransferase
MLVVCPIAGVGSRLFPITRDKPKVMIKVAGKRIIDHLMNKIEQTFINATQICFIVGFCKDQLIDYLRKNYSSKFELLFVEQKPVDFKNNYPFYSGLGDAIALTAKYGRGEDCFIILSDRYPMENYTPMIKAPIKLDGCINVQRVENPQYYGVIKLNKDGLIEKIIEKPKDFITNIAVSGAYYFRKSVTNEMYDILEEQSKQPVFEYKEHDFTSTIQNLLDKGYKLGYNLMKRPVLDFGRPDNLLQANQILIRQLNTKICVGERSNLITSDIGVYTSIGSDTILENCNTENSIIGDNCNLSNVSLKNVIVDDNSNNINFQNRSIQL